MLSQRKTHFDLSGYRVAVGGGSRGIGRAMVLAFLASGADVSVCARQQAGLDALRDDARDDAQQLYTCACDLGQSAQIESWIAEAARCMGGLDVIVHNATGYGFREVDEDWLRGFNVDLMAGVRTSRYALPHLKRSRYASILYVSSISALRPRPLTPAYAAIKASINNYVMTQALVLAKQKIRVNAIAPGSIEFKNGLWDKYKREDPRRYSEKLSTVPFGRFGVPEEISNVALFLSSPSASWITGQTIVVDGGQSLRS